ncbi:ependymin [Triplophysa dalaica]|uniref:ependymin n=1 Tax=Triplophysa dalaica TaxID=1582913 RepID=UPI0024E010B3|nr:ependymin [Triplophysa dalaica]
MKGDVYGPEERWRAMMCTVKLLFVVFSCLCVVAWASSNRQPCHSAPLTSGTMKVVSTGGHDLASGEFNYDSKANKFRFVEDTTHANKTSHLDVLIHFDEGVLYEMDSKNESCKKETLQFRKHLMEIPPDATHESEIYLGSPSITEQGLRVRVWTGNFNELHAHYSLSTTSCGCLTVSGSYFGEKKDLHFNFFGVETEVDDPQVFVLPAYCEGISFEEAPDDHSFFDLFHD